MVVQSKITTVIEADTMNAIELAFKDIYCHGAQDIARNTYLQKPVFVCSIDGTIEAYAFIDMHKLKRASLWYGPVIRSPAHAATVFKELFRCLTDSGVWTLLLYPLSFEISAAIQLLVEKHALFTVAYGSGISTAVKHLPKTAAGDFNEALSASYNSDFRRSLKKAVNSQLEVLEIVQERDLEDLIAVFIELYQHKAIPVKVASIRDKLMAEFNYINATKRGAIYAARLDGQIVGGLVQIYTRNVAMYIHAASNKSLKVPIMHYIIHHGMIQACLRGMQYYDLGVIATDKAKQAWNGFTFFKLSFSSVRMDYPEPISISNKKWKSMAGQLIEWGLEMTRAILGKKKQTPEISFDLE